MRWSRAGFGALVTVLCLTGCASKQEKTYRREANEICAAAHKRLGDAESPSSLAGIAKAAEREMAIREKAIAELEGLAPPVKIRGGATNVLGGLEARQERARAVKKAAEDKDRSKLREIEEHGKKESELETQQARDAGLRDCAEL